MPAVFSSDAIEIFNRLEIYQIQQILCEIYKVISKIQLIF